ncbi:PREDICTED: inactive pancreatic lipase-related protein 1-like [Papilio polytes]|uniref:inactive pancreatic lipase-related protein 1-like n=1 Tax=Papilio polytes TaxID=76194 RepID=UPI0006760AA1|nr:PREDICTED: inactive pancreatic lipase-related protein 1-like [Papilio polytes]
MNYLVTMFVGYMSLLKASGQQQGNLIENLGEGIQQQIRPLKQPIDESIAYIGSAGCPHVKKLLGVAYEQLEGVKEPDLNSLSLFFKTRISSRVYNISVAAEAITRARAFDPQRKLIIFVHGFIDDPTKDSFKNISEAFLRSGETSVIALDGSPLIRWLYLRATTYVRFMGRKLGEVLAAMVNGGTDPASIHLIGHSLGSHISGFAGKTLFKLTGRKPGRLTALDPAGPCFTNVEKDLRVKDTDADYVDCIHSDSGVYGMKEPVGHADYFPNGGHSQPGCLLQTCSHSRSWLYFAESLLEVAAFSARRCASWEHFKRDQCDDEISNMGIDSKPNTRGKFFLQTGFLFPYGRGDEGLKYRDPPNLIQAVAGSILKDEDQDNVHSTASILKDQDPKKLLESVASSLDQDPKKLLESIAGSLDQDPTKLLKSVAGSLDQDPTKILESVADSVKDHPSKLLHSVAGVLEDQNPSKLFKSFTGSVFGG